MPVPPEVLSAAHRALDAGVNRYTHPRGLQTLREAVASKLSRHNAITADPETEIVITAGATGALETVCAALLNPGDEVVTFSPFYAYHRNTIHRFGAKQITVPLGAADLSIDWEALRTALNGTVKFLLLNTPHNPTGKVFSSAEISRIGELCAEHDVWIVTDEVYEYMTYDGRRHVSPASLHHLRDRVITIGAYSKTFAITGWRIGYVVAPREMAARLADLADSIFVCPPAPLQQAVAEALGILTDQYFTELRARYETKRNFFCDGLRKVGFRVAEPEGAYYALANFRDISPQLTSAEFVDRMILRCRVGGVPSDDFVDDPSRHPWVRFCFALSETELEKALTMLEGLNS